MSRATKVFVPHPPCTVTSGDCFREGRCLDNCQKRYEGNCQQKIRALLERITQLDARVSALEKKA